MKCCRDRFNVNQRIYEDLLEAIQTITPAIALIKESNKPDIDMSNAFDLIEQIDQYNQYAKFFAGKIDVKAVRFFMANELTEEEKLAMLYFVFNSNVKFYVRKNIANELKKAFPEEINAIKKYGFTNTGLESFIK